MPKENEQLEAMLAEVQQEAQQRAQEAPQEAPEPQPPAAPEKASEAPKEAPKPATEPEDDEAEVVDQNGVKFVPHQQYNRERQRRVEWKEKYARADGELAALRRQLEDAQKQRQAPPPQQQQPQFIPPPDFNQNPGGYLAYMVEQNQKQILNERLNTSEAMMRDRIGDEKLDAYVTDFRTAAEADPALWGKLYSQPHPYGWLMRQMDTWRMHRDIGNDPDAYRAKIVAEERAKWEAEVTSSTSRTPPASPAAHLPPSLANVRSMAARNEPAYTGPPSDADVLAPIQQRKGGTSRW